MASSLLQQQQQQLWKKPFLPPLISQCLRIASTTQKRRTGIAAAFSSSSSSSSVSGRTDEEVKAMFDEWVFQHGKSYKKREPKESAFKNYRDSLARFDLDNKDPRFGHHPLLEESADRRAGGLLVPIRIGPGPGPEHLVPWNRKEG